MSHVTLKGLEAVKASLIGASRYELLRRKKVWEQCLEMVNKELEKTDAKDSGNDARNSVADRQR